MRGGRETKRKDFASSPACARREATTKQACLVCRCHCGHYAATHLGKSFRHLAESLMQPFWQHRRRVVAVVILLLQSEIGLALAACSNAGTQGLRTRGARTLVLHAVVHVIIIGADRFAVAAAFIIKHAQAAAQWKWRCRRVRRRSTFGMANKTSATKLCMLAHRCSSAIFLASAKSQRNIIPGLPRAHFQVT